LPDSRGLVPAEQCGTISDDLSATKTPKNGDFPTGADSDAGALDFGP
jgi:hypothetical protein